jgi:desulfoferrodoxin (superoxide reductase-like protein)
MKTSILLAAWYVCAVVLFPGTVLANKSAVSIEAPPTAARGSEVVITLTVTHNANSTFHYTNWVRLDVDGKMVDKWEYTKDNRPDGATFKKEIKVTVTGTTELVAEANCNRHGSAGAAKAVIKVQE